VMQWNTEHASVDTVALLRANHLRACGIMVNNENDVGSHGRDQDQHDHALAESTVESDSEPDGANNDLVTNLKPQTVKWIDKESYLRSKKGSKIPEEE
jgi:hypothetical protein